MLRRREPGEKGEVSVSAVLMFPVLLLMIWAVLLTSFAWFARGNLQAAASDALSAYQESASGLGETIDPVATGQATATRHAGFVRNVVVSGPTVASRRDRVTFTVTGEVPGPFPGMTLTIVGRASGPVELFRPQGDLP